MGEPGCALRTATNVFVEIDGPPTCATLVAMGRLAGLLLVLLTGCPDDQPPAGPPEADDCAGDGTGAAIESLEIGIGGEAGEFVPLADGDPFPTVWGGQGGFMTRLRFRVTGPTAPDCLPLDIQVETLDGMPMGESITPLRTYLDETDGSRTTRDHFVILESEMTSAVVTATALTRIATRRLDGPPAL